MLMDAWASNHLNVFFFSHLFSCLPRSDMVVRSIGNSLLVILPELVGKKITNWFDLVRPLIAFKFQTVSSCRCTRFQVNCAKLFSLSV